MRPSLRTRCKTVALARPAFGCSGVRCTHTVNRTKGISAAESDECWPYHLHGGNAAMHKAGMPTHALRISTRPIRVEQANIPVLHRNRLEPGINRNPVRCPLGSEAAIADGLLHAIAGTGLTSSVITLKPASVHGPNEVTIATSVASRPRAIRMRPMRG